MDLKVYQAIDFYNLEPLDAPAAGAEPATEPVLKPLGPTGKTAEYAQNAQDLDAYIRAEMDLSRLDYPAALEKVKTTRPDLIRIVYRSKTW
jgi:hypothetical protein